MSQPPEIKINHQDWETISTLIRGHRSINHSLSPLWPQLTQCSLCYPHHSGCRCILHMGQLRMQTGLITQSSIYFWAKWKPDKNAAPGNVFGWRYFDADESWHCVRLFDESTANISQASSLRSRFLTPYLSPSTKTPSSKERWEVSYTEPSKDLQPASIITHHRLLSSDTTIKNTELLVVIFFNSCPSDLTSRLVHHHTFTQLPRATRLTPLSPRNQGPWGASQHRFEVERIKEERPVELGWWG